MHKGVKEKINKIGLDFPELLETMSRDKVDLNNLWPFYVENKWVEPVVPFNCSSSQTPEK